MTGPAGTTRVVLSLRCGVCGDEHEINSAEATVIAGDGVLYLLTPCPTADPGVLASKPLTHPAVLEAVLRSQVLIDPDARELLEVRR